MEISIRDAGFILLNHPPYSPDIAPSDYRVFSKLKKHLRGRSFSSNDDANFACVDDFLEGQNKEFFSSGIDAFPGRWQRVITQKGHYIE